MPPKVLQHDPALGPVLSMPLCGTTCFAAYKRLTCVRERPGQGFSAQCQERRVVSAASVVAHRHSRQQTHVIIRLQPWFDQAHAHAVSLRAPASHKELPFLGPRRCVEFTCRCTDHFLPCQASTSSAPTLFASLAQPPIVSIAKKSSPSCIAAGSCIACSILSTRAGSRRRNFSHFIDAAELDVPRPLGACCRGCFIQVKQGVSSANAREIWHLLPLRPRC